MQIINLLETKENLIIANLFLISLDLILWRLAVRARKYKMFGAIKLPDTQAKTLDVTLTITASILFLFIAWSLYMSATSPSWILQ